jgi:hypothetical protein
VCGFAAATAERWPAMTMNIIEFNVYGRAIAAERVENRWRLSTPSREGKRRAIDNIVVPDDIVTESDLLRFLQDLYHESARPERHEAFRVERKTTTEINA